MKRKTPDKNEIATQFNVFLINIRPQFTNNFKANGRPDCKSNLNNSTVNDTSVNDNDTAQIRNSMKQKTSIVHDSVCSILLIAC